MDMTRGNQQRYTDALGKHTIISAQLIETREWEASSVLH